jgi:hypothetical protein
MALDITYTFTTPIGGSAKALTRVEGSCHANGVSSGDISGLTKFVRHLYAWEFTPRQNLTAGAFHVVKSLDAVNDTEKLTLTCTNGDYFDFWYIGEAMGDQ